MGLMSYMRALVNRKRTASPPTPRWIVAYGSVIVPFTIEGEDPDITWEYILLEAFKGRRADRIGDAIYLTGQPNGFEGRAQ